jgi:transglutaminase-like putative cysteine protease
MQDRARSWWRRGAVCLLVLLSPLSALAAKLPPGVTIGPRPAWAPALVVEGVREPESSQGIAALGFATVVRRVAGTLQIVTQSVSRVTSEMGASAVGEQTFTFVPPHQELVLHEVAVRRNGKLESRLRPSAIQVLQREARLESGVYDGTRTAVVILSDVRVGDEIVAECSVVGANPVAQGQFGTLFALGAPGSIGRVERSVLSDEPLRYRMFGVAPEPELGRNGGLYEYRWTRSDVPAFHSEEGAPPESELDTLPLVQVSSLSEWSDVARWGTALFQAPATLPPALAEWRDEALKLAEPEARILKVLRLVQDRVRYLSLSFAESSHRPSSPAQVLEQGFGDCKDKSLLAVTLLRSLGLNAEVALVRSGDGGMLQRLLPTHTAFDHAIVSVELEGKRYFLDPTRIYQRGRLSDVAARGFRYALRLAKDVNDLTIVDEPADLRPELHAFQRYEVTGFGAVVQLDLSITFTGARAEAMRALRASGSQKELNDTLGRAVLTAYPKARRTGDARVEDSEANNEITALQSFQLDADDWIVTEDDRKFLSVVPIWLVEQLTTISSERKQPLVLPFPLDISHVIEVNAPVSFSDEDSADLVKADAFKLKFERKIEDKRVTLHFGYSTLADRVETPAFGDYRRAISKAVKLADYMIVEPPRFKMGSRVLLFSIVAAWSLVLVGLVWLVQVRDPRLRHPELPLDRKLAGKRGWLILVGIGVTLAPLRLVTELIAVANTFSAENWSALTVAGNPSYQPGWDWLLTFELLCNETILVGSCLSAYLYWTDRRSFPLVHVVVLGLHAAFSVIVTRLVASMSETVAADAPGTWSADPSVIAAHSAVWMFYLVKSRRVQATFRRRSPYARSRKARVRTREEPLAEATVSEDT